jgi:hypothetical protein
MTEIIPGHTEVIPGKMSNKFRFTILLNKKRDDDILQWLARQDNRSAAVRDAIRRKIGEGGKAGEEITLRDIMDELREIKRNGFVVVTTDGEMEAEPEDIAATLDELGK